MRQFDRRQVEKPTSLLETTEKDAVKAFKDNPANAGLSFKFKAYKRDDVRLRLEELFRGKCAYCETVYSSTAPVDVEHFRPKNSPAEDAAHPGYWWLAMDWDNLLPSCIDCNRRREQIVVAGPTSLAELWRRRRPVDGNATEQAGKGRSFPIAGHRANDEQMLLDAEAHMLVDPCREDPGLHVDFRVFGEGRVSLAVPRGSAHPSERGAATIQTFGLNRLGLVQERTRLIRRLEFMRELLIDLDQVTRVLNEPGPSAALAGTAGANAVNTIDRVIKRILDEMRASASPDQPHSAAAAAWLRDFAASI